MTTSLFSNKESKSVQSSTVDSSEAEQIHKSYDGNRSRAIGYGRVFFVGALMAAAAVLGYFTEHFLHQAEDEKAQMRYESAVQHALEMTRTIAKNKLHGTSALAKVVEYAVPNVQQWPFITVPGFFEIANDIVPTSIAGGLSVAPIVLPEQVPTFEAFAYDFFDKQFPGQHAAESDFGKGIYSRDCGSQFPDGKCHDTTGQVDFDTPMDILTPKLLHSKGNHPLLMYNVHHEVVKGSVIDAGIQCGRDNALVENRTNVHCQAVSEMVFSTKNGAGAFVVTPIFPDQKTVRFVPGWGSCYSLSLSGRQ